MDQQNEIREFRYNPETKEWVVAFNDPRVPEIRLKNLEAVESFLDQLEIGQ